MSGYFNYSISNAIKYDLSDKLNPSIYSQGCGYFLQALYIKTIISNLTEIHIWNLKITFEIYIFIHGENNLTFKLRNPLESITLNKEFYWILNVVDIKSQHLNFKIISIQNSRTQISLETWVNFFLSCELTWNNFSVL